MGPLAREKGIIIVFVAPSGTGKSTLLKRTRERFPHFQESVSYTTREKRPGEREGVEYFFVDKGEFHAMREQGDFLEWARVHEHFYGTSAKFVEEKLAHGSPLFFDLDIQGARALKEHFGASAHVIFISPPSLSALEERLRGRGTESEFSLALRLENAKKEMAKRGDFDYCVINDNLDKATEELATIIQRILETHLVQKT